MRSKDRPSRQDTFIGQARREQFLDCAIDALAEVGFAGTSLAEVANRAGVAKSVVSYHFAARAALLEAVVAKIYGDAASQLSTTLDGAETERARLAAYIRGCVDFAWLHRRQCHALGEVFRNLRTEDGGLRYTAEGNAELLDAVEAILLAGQRTAEFGEFHSRTVALMLRSTIDGLPAYFDADSTIDGTETAEHLVALFDVLTGAAPSLERQ